MLARFPFLASFALGSAVASAAALAGGCGPSVAMTPPSTGGSGGSGGSSTIPTTTWGTGAWDAGADALPDYEDPGCPDAGPPVQDFQCDPYHQNNGDCAPGEGCYIYVIYPQEVCGQETYGAVCSPAGPGTQGSGCGGVQDCAAGFCCVVSGSGDQCVQLCPLVGDSGCPDGLVCEPIDVEGFGGCL